MSLNLSSFILFNFFIILLQPDAGRKAAMPNAVADAAVADAANAAVADAAVADAEDAEDAEDTEEEENIIFISRKRYVIKDVSHVQSLQKL